MEANTESEKPRQWRKIYRCGRCFCFARGNCPAVSRAEAEQAQRMAVDGFDHPRVEHRCADGGLGVATFVGIEEQVPWQKTDNDGGNRYDEEPRT